MSNVAFTQACFEGSPTFSEPRGSSRGPCSCQHLGLAVLSLLVPSPLLLGGDEPSLQTRSGAVLLKVDSVPASQAAF